MAHLRIFVSNLPWTVGHGELRRYFKDFGRVVKSTVVFNKSTGTSKGYGFITFADANAWENVSNQQNHELEGWKLSVQKSHYGKNN